MDNSRHGAHDDTFVDHESVDPVSGFIRRCEMLSGQRGRLLTTVAVERRHDGVVRTNEVTNVSEISEEVSARHWEGGVRIRIGCADEYWGAAILLSPQDAEHFGWILIGLAKTAPQNGAASPDAPVPEGSP